MPYHTISMLEPYIMQICQEIHFTQKADPEAGAEAGAEAAAKAEAEAEAEAGAGAEVGAWVETADVFQIRNTQVRIMKEG